VNRLEEELNLYGDKSHVLDQSHGTDISSVRFDELDRAYIAQALQDKTNIVVDLGCGRGVPSLIVSTFGNPVRLYDLYTDEIPIAALKTIFHEADVQEFKGDLSTQAGAATLPARIDILYSQRFLHFLRYEDALALLSAARKTTAKGCCAFLSASGMTSELSIGYGPGSEPVRRRFGKLSPAMADKHQIRELLCLYSKDEFAALLEEAGFGVEKIWLSEFGNVKGRFTTD
jgi:hypothetical protein